LASTESSSGVDSKYPVNLIQSLGHVGRRASWRSGCVGWSIFKTLLPFKLHHLLRVYPLST